MKKNQMFKIVCFIFTMILSCFAVLGVALICHQNIELEKKIEFYENECFREAEIIYATDCCVYVFDDYVNNIIEIDIWDELIYTTIEVGDIALYVVDYNYTDAELLGIIKK